MILRAQVAEEVEAELTKYKAAVASLTSKTQVTPEDVGVQSTDVRFHSHTTSQRPAPTHRRPCNV